MSYIHGESQSTKLLEEVKELREVNEDLEAQLCDMEKFLADYGLVWVDIGSGSGREVTRR